VFKFASLGETNEFHGSAVSPHPSGAVRPEIPNEFSHSQEPCQVKPGLVNPLHWRARCRCSADSGAIGTARLLARSAAAGERLSVTDSRVTAGDFPAGQRGGLRLARIPPPFPPHPRFPGAVGPREHPGRRRRASALCIQRLLRPEMPDRLGLAPRARAGSSPRGAWVPPRSHRSRPGLPERRREGRLRPRDGSSWSPRAPSTPTGGEARSPPRRPRPPSLLHLAAGRLGGEQAAPSPTIPESVEEGNPLG
jgi:hypothetical protein